MPVAPRYYSSREMLEVVGSTRKALRVIEARGLLQPARRAGARRYSSECLRRLWLILLLRRLGFSLDDVVRLVGVGDSATAAGEAARALASSTTRVIRRIDGTIRDLELARDALVTTRGTLEACGSCTRPRAACDGCARSGKLDAVAAVLLTAAGRQLDLGGDAVAAADRVVEPVVRPAGPGGQPDLVRRVQRRRP